MPKFSSHFRLNANQSQLDFVDIDTDEDIPVYVDPFAIEIRSDAWSSKASSSIRSFFLEVLDALRSGDDTRAISLMSNLHEPSETFLGVSTGVPQGRGVGARQAGQLIKAIKDSAAFKSGLLEDLSEMALFVQNVDRDKISDLTTNVIRHHLVEYTQQQCGLFSIPTSDYNGPPMWDDIRKNWVSRIVKLPHIEETPVLLVPKFVVRRTLSLNSSEFYSKQITDFLIAENLNANSSLVQTLKSGAKKVYKRDVREKYPKSKEMIAEMVSAHPELLDYYRDMAKHSGILANIREDDATIGRVCAELEAALEATPKGREAADKYHAIAMGIITTCFHPQLIQPRKEWEINSGRKRIDIVYTNAADEGFFAHRRDGNNTQATMVIVECKNYSKDLANPEFDQLLGRFDNNRGRFGILTCREIDRNETALERCRDAAKSGNGYILIFTDADLLKFLKLRKVGKIGEMEEILHDKFSRLIS